MKKVFLLLSIAGILILDFVALDDIMTGREPNLLLEYAILVLTIPLLAVIVFFATKKWRKNIEDLSKS